MLTANRIQNVLISLSFCSSASASVNSLAAALSSSVASASASGSASASASIALIFWKNPSASKPTTITRLVMAIRTTWKKQS